MNLRKSKIGNWSSLFDISLTKLSPSYKSIIFAIERLTVTVIQFKLKLGVIDSSVSFFSFHSSFIRDSLLFYWRNLMILWITIQVRSHMRRLEINKSLLEYKTRKQECIECLCSDLFHHILISHQIAHGEHVSIYPSRRVLHPSKALLWLLLRAIFLL